MNKALAIPELCEEIAQYLSQATLSSCIKVSTTWHEGFTPSLWSQVHLGLHSELEHPSQPALETVSKYKEFVQSLSFHEKMDLFPIEFFDLNNNNSNNHDAFPRLTRLRFELYYPCLAHVNPQAIFGPFIQAHGATLTHLSLKPGPRSAAKDWTFDWMASCHRLRSFTFTGGTMNAQSWRRCLEAWRSCGLVELDLNCVNFLEDVRSTPPAGPTVVLLPIQRLRIRARPDHAKQWIGLLRPLCPKVVRLEWIRDQLSATLLQYEEEREATGAFIHSLKEGFFPNLKQLKFVGFHQNRYLLDVLEVLETRQQSSLLLLPVPPTKRRRQQPWEPQQYHSSEKGLLELTAERTFGARTWKALQFTLKDHWISLKSLDLQKTYGRISSMDVHEMLCSLPSLETFIGAVLSNTCFQENARPWVCSRLKFLRVTVVVSKIKDKRGEALSLSPPQKQSEGHLQLLRRIGRLTNLEHLQVGYFGDEQKAYPTCQPLKFQYGWGLLEDLGRKLVVVDMAVPEELTDNDLAWMVRHWPFIEKAPANVLEAYARARRL